MKVKEQVLLLQDQRLKLQNQNKSLRSKKKKLKVLCIYAETKLLSIY